MIIDFVFLIVGIFIGYNWRNQYAESKENKLYNQVDESVRSELAIAKNLNKSLLDDVKFLREKLQRQSH